METNGAVRRAFIRGAIVGGTGSVIMATGPVQAAVWTPRPVRASSLQVGDLICGPSGAVVRVHSLTRLPNANIRIRYTNPCFEGPRELALDAAKDISGYGAKRLFVVFARSVTERVVKIGTTPVDSIDGGRP